MSTIDLHVHSTKSDGSYSPSDLVDYALSKGLKAFALTDHDTVSGIDEAISHAKGKGIEVIPGVELSTDYNGKDIHIVGLYIDRNNPTLLSKLEAFRLARDVRNEKMCEKLRAEGIDINPKVIQEAYGESVITRAHYAKYMYDKGYINNVKEAFERYIGDHAKCYVPKEKVTCQEGVKLILDAGGIPILAHPCLYHMSDSVLEGLVSTLKDAGLVGIEAIYSTYTLSEERQIKAIAKKFGLSISGGSDFHGASKPGLDIGTGYGKLEIPYNILLNLRKKLMRKKIFFTDLDNTLLTTDKKITPKTRQALDSWLEDGNYIAFSSGRPLESVLAVVRENNLVHDNVYAIGFNGALIYHIKSGKKITEKPLSLEQVKKIYQVAKANNIYCHTYDDDNILVPYDGKEIQFYTRTVKLPIKVLDDFENEVTIPPYKFLCIDLDETGKLDLMIEKLKEANVEGLVTVKSNSKYLEVFSDKSGKGSAVIELADHLGVDVRDTIAAGDEQNDISMIQAAGLGIAMCNGRDIVKESADVVTEKDNNNDGLVPYLI